MNKLNLPSFYVGQRVVALINHSQGAYKKGDEFVVLRITKRCCNWQIDVGVKSWANNITCSACEKNFLLNDNTWWFNQSRFAPLQQQNFPLIKLSKIMEKEKEEILIEN